MEIKFKTRKNEKILKFSPNPLICLTGYDHQLANGLKQKTKGLFGMG